MEHTLPHTESSTSRIEAFSDGVLAIVITLMVLEIKIPDMAKDISNREAILLMTPLLPKVLAYGISFIMVSIFWVNHHQLFHSIQHSTRGLLWLNTIWLFWICLLPFPTAFLGEHPTLLFALLVFGAELFLCSLSFYFIRYYCFQQNLFHPEFSFEISKQLLRKSMLGPVLYLTSVALSFVSVYLSYVIFIVVPTLFIVSTLKLFKK